ncbi:MAG: CheR family methyltransferase, partial [Acidiferrobacteraceae bacterium]
MPTGDPGPGSLATGADRDRPVPGLTISDGEFRRLRDLIRHHTGILLPDHKRALLCSRLARRLRHYHLARYQDYYDLLTRGPESENELEAMINAITTRKTQFFREPHHFQFLVERILVPLQDQASRSKPLRIWSAGTASGEEAYSIAMAVRHAIRSRADAGVSIIATDISTDALNCGRAGIYPIASARHIPQALLHRYFLKGRGSHDGKIVAKPELRSLIRFEPLNLMDDSWALGGRFDVIFCRNVLIYFDQEMQRKVVSRFRSVLAPDGTLILGHSEALHG